MSVHYCSSIFTSSSSTHLVNEKPYRAGERFGMPMNNHESLLYKWERAEISWMMCWTYPRFISSSTANLTDLCNISMIIWLTCTNLHHLHNSSARKTCQWKRFRRSYIWHWYLHGQVHLGCRVRCDHQKKWTTINHTKTTSWPLVGNEGSFIPNIPASKGWGTLIPYESGQLEKGSTNKQQLI